MFSRASSSRAQQELAKTAGRNSSSDLRHGGILHGLDRQAPTHPRHPKTRWHVRYRDGTTQRSRRHLSHQGRSAQRLTRGRTGRARRILRPTLTRPRSMLFGEYVTTIWWPNWDALAGPLQSAGAPIGGRHLVRCHLPGVLSRSSTLRPMRSRVVSPRRTRRGDRGMSEASRPRQASPAGRSDHDPRRPARQPAPPRPAR